MVDPAIKSGDPHWNEEAKSFLGGLIMFCVAHEEPTRRNLGAVREYLTLPPDRLAARSANSFLGKADREAASVLSNAQRHTHFLDSPRIAKVMSRSDFYFSEFRHRITSVFLVLPPNRLDAYSRWLRLLVSQALQDIARNTEVSATLARPQSAPQGPVVGQKALNPHIGFEALL